MMKLMQLSSFLLLFSNVDSFLEAIGPRRCHVNCPARHNTHRPTKCLVAQQDAAEITSDRSIIKLEEDQLQRRIQGITAIASDVDGTLLGTDHKLSTKTKSVIERAVQQVQNGNGALKHFFPATGKSRKGALDSLGPDIRDLLSQLPGVFIQGLYCVDADGTIIFEKKLSPKAVAASEVLAAKFGATVIGNCGDEIYCNPTGDPGLLEEVNGKWGEPVPIQIESLAAPDAPQFHKLVFMSNDVDMLRDEMRPELEVLAKENEGAVTSSFPTVLEILPAGCSKALGVQKLCEKLGIDPTTDLLAMGDAENDKLMLEMAAIGVAMGNASPVAKAAADVELEESSSEGGAGLAMERYSPLGRTPS